jgi:DNA-binding CsgD family transcriptional regulator
MPPLLGAAGPLWAASGELGALASAVQEMRAISELTQAEPIACGALWLAALRGDEREFAAVAAAAVDDAVTRGEGRTLAVAEMAGATLHNALGHYDAALDRLGDGTPAHALPELVEAAARCGRSDLAARALESLGELADATGSEWALGVRARSAALLGEGDEARFHEAIDRLGRTGVDLELARARLLYGEWLRRRRRRHDAREQLRGARETFVQMGAHGFASRAERELAATGERVRRRTDGSFEELTAREAQIARLAGEGLGNAEIGAQLFISPRTVEYHLYKVFSKLRVSSRSELRGQHPALAA